MTEKSLARELAGQGVNYAKKSVQLPAVVIATPPVAIASGIGTVVESAYRGFCSGADLDGFGGSEFIPAVLAYGAIAFQTGYGVLAGRMVANAGWAPVEAVWGKFKLGRKIAGYVGKGVNKARGKKKESLEDVIGDGVLVDMRDGSGEVKITPLDKDGKPVKSPGEKVEAALVRANEYGAKAEEVVEKAEGKVKGTGMVAGGSIGFTLAVAETCVGYSVGYMAGLVGRVVMLPFS